MLPLTLHSLKKKVTSAVYERGHRGCKTFIQENKTSFRWRAKHKYWKFQLAILIQELS